MGDNVDRETRSRMMRAIGPRDTEPEMKVRRYLHSAGLRYGLHNRNLPGRPDMVFRRYRTVVFVHGCFWHRHKGCMATTVPGTNKPFWTGKFEGNVARDKRNVLALRALGWQVLVIWECELKREASIDRLFWKVVGSEA